MKLTTIVCELIFYLFVVSLKLHQAVQRSLQQLNVHISQTFQHFNVL